MARWRAPALLVIAIAALLGMHGLDAAGAAAHGGAAVAGSGAGMEQDAPARPDGHGGLGHAVIACVAIVLTVATARAAWRVASVRRQPLLDLARAAHRVMAPLAAVDPWPPPRFATCVVLR